MSLAAVVVGGVLLLAALVVGELLTRKVVRPNPQPVERHPEDVGVPYESVAVPSGDVALSVWLLVPEGAGSERPLFVLAHGWGANHGTVLRLGGPLARAGYPVVVFDTRGHGTSPSVPYVTVRNFRDDLASVIDYARGRFPGRRIVVVGHSLGGAAAVLSAADGAPVDALVLIAAPSDVVRVTAEYLSDHDLPGHLMMRVLRPFLWLRVGGTFFPLTPRRRIRELTLPILVVQPEHDARVDRAHAQELAHAAGVELHLVRGREHTDVLEAPETLRLIEDFVAPGS